MPISQLPTRTGVLLGLAVLVAGVLGIDSAVAAAPASGSVTSAGSGVPLTVALHGTLVVRPAERPGRSTSYAVSLRGGRVVPVRGSFPPGLRTGATFSGSVALPASLVASLRSRDAGAAADGQTVPAGPLHRDATGVVSTALRLATAGGQSLTVVGDPAFGAPAAAAPAGSGTVHHVYVAAVDGHGDLTQADSQLLAHVTTVGAYWKGEAGSAISGIVVPGTVRHVASPSAGADCGLGNDFWGVVQDAEKLFPGIEPFSGSDQLVVFVPPACSSGGVVGMGTLGRSFASGGAVVVKAGSAIEGTFAHEAGHTYGLDHADALAGPRSLEYFGLYDVMGFALSGVNQLTALSTPYRVEQGVTQPGEIVTVPLGDGTTPVQRTVSLLPRSGDSGVRSVEVTDPDTGAALYLDYRSGTGLDAGSFYAAGGSLASPVGGLRYRRGVVLGEVRGDGDDTLVEDGTTSLVSGSTWSNASGTVLVRVGSVTPQAATVTVAYSPAAAWSATGTPTVSGPGSGPVSVGGTATVDAGAWSPAPSRVAIRWYADGRPLAGTDDLTTVTPGPAQLGQALVAEVTAYGAGLPTTTVRSAPVTVRAGSLQVTGRPSIQGTARVGATLRAVSTSTAPALAAVSSSWHWRVDGVPVPGATGRTFVPPAEDVGARITVRETFTATGYRAAHAESPRTPAVGRR